MLRRARLLSLLWQARLRSSAGVPVLQSRDERDPACGEPSRAPDTSCGDCSRGPDGSCAESSLPSD